MSLRAEAICCVRFMNQGLNNQNFQTENAILCDYLQCKLSQEAPQKSLHDFFEESLEAIVDFLLDAALGGEAIHYRKKPDGQLGQLLVSLSQDHVLKVPQIAEFYERLSGLSLESDQRGRLTLTSSLHRRRSRGQFYTPPSIANEIVKLTLDAFCMENILDPSNLNILDPSVGCGVFLRTVIKEISNRIPSKTSEPRANFAFRLHGVDTDHVAVKIARASLLSALKAVNDQVNWEVSNIRVGNSLIGRDMPPSTCGNAERFGTTATRQKPTRWFNGSPEGALVTGGQVFDWPKEFPHVFHSDNPGFDIVIGNPPYEVLSANDSWTEHAYDDLKYFRTHYTTCQGKINTYRLMLERSLKLLKCGGALGFIIPATFLADSTAKELRRKILDECEITNLITIPEKARLFSRVTQALTIMVALKGKPSVKVKPITWSSQWPACDETGVEIDVGDLNKIGGRIPILRSEIEGRLLNHLMSFSTMSSGDRGIPQIKAHQGEINLTTHRMFICAEDTGIKLARGEHIGSFTLNHPSSRPDRLDWIKPEIYNDMTFIGSRKIDRIQSVINSTAEKGRVAIARVANMDCKIRLKAAWVPEGIFLGDMTNYLDNVLISPGFTLGLLNSGLLNWRFKLLSANNYVSASEIEALPIPYRGQAPEHGLRNAGTFSRQFMPLLSSICSLHAASEMVDEFALSLATQETAKTFLTDWLDGTAGLIITNLNGHETDQALDGALRFLLDALVLKLYEAQRFQAIFGSA